MSEEEEKLVRIQRIQRKFQEDLSSEKRLKYLKYLSNVTISLDILKETSIGKTVNLMRKEDGVIGQIAGKLLAKWKEMATSEYGCHASKQQLKEKTISNKNKVENEPEKHSKNDSSNSLCSKEGSSCNSSSNGMLTVKREVYSSSSPSKPKMNENHILKRLDDMPSTHSSSSSSSSSSSKKTLREFSTPLEEEHSSDTESSVPRSKSKTERLNIEKDINKKKEKKIEKHSTSALANNLSDEELNEDENEDIPVQNETRVEESSPSKVPDVKKKKQCKSFEEMLMMPVLPVKKKKKKSKLKLHEELPKLPPTLPDIELPQINTVPVYRPSRPLPNISVKEDVKKKALEPPPAPTLSFADITSRKTKSVMYTGKKTTNGVVTSLYQMCMRILIENVDALYETGGVPFSVLEPLLAKCTPAQLERLESYNYYLIQDTDGLWKKHCQIEFRGRRIDDDSVAAWRDMYKELQLEREEKLRRLSQKISLSQAQKIPERSVKLAFVATAPKPSVQILRKQKQKEKERERRKNKEDDKQDGLRQKEIRERMVKEQQESSEHVPFTKVPRQDRCSKRPPSSLSSSNLDHEPKKPKHKEKEELGSCGPAELMPTPIKKKKGKSPMMQKALKLLSKQKSRMGAQIMRK